MSVDPSTVIFSGDDAGPNDLWEPTSIFRANWGEGIRVRTAFITQIDAARTEAEQRRGGLGRPYRTIEASLLACNSNEARSLYDNTMRHAIAKSMVPFYSDQSYLTQPSQGTLYCDTTSKRFFVGGRVLVQDKSGEIAYSTIASITDSTIVLDDPLYREFARGSIVYPILEARLNFDASMTAITDEILELPLSATELPSVASLDALSIPGSTPVGFSLFEGKPVLDIYPNWGDEVAIKIHRAGNFAASGITQVPSAYGRIARGNVEFSTVFGDRASAFRLIRFFESRGGSLHSFWVPSPLTAYSPISVAGSTVTVQAIGPENNWEWRKVVAQLYPGGIALRRVLSVARTGFSDVLTLDSPLPAALSGSRLVDVYQARFTDDELVEEWETDRVCSIAVKTTEVLEEKSITISDINEPVTTPITARFSPTSSQSEASVANVKMYFRPCETPGTRPLVRAADLSIPNKISVTVASGQVAFDPDFTPASGAVSSNLLTAVQDTFECVYVGSTSQVSRHWHNFFISATPSVAPGHNGTDVAVTRYLYEATKTYLGGDDEEHTLTVRITVLDPTTLLGCRSALIHGYIFSDEVNPDYVEDAAFGPFNIPFNRDDPAVYAGLYGATSSEDMRALHPQCVLHFYVPTTFESPCGNIPWGFDTEVLLHGFSEDCKAVASAIPWLPESVGATYDNGLQNFTYSDDLANPYSAVMLGGDCPHSSLVNFLVVENGSSVSGLSALRPLKDGLTDDRLNVLEGSAVTITFCDSDQSLNDMSCCDGHPDEPLGGIGGTPKCWKASEGSPAGCINLPGEARSEDLAKRCCFSINSAASVDVNQKCLVETITLDEFCNEIENCLSEDPIYNWSLGAGKSWSFSLPVVSADFSIVDPSNRVFTWMRYYPTILQTRYVWDEDFDSVDPLTWDTYGGTWSDFTAGSAVSPTPSGSNNVKAKAMLTGTGALTGLISHINSTVSVEVDTSGAAGILARGSTGDGTTSGYLALADVANEWFRLYWLDSGSNTKVLLAEVTSVEGWPSSGPFRISLSCQGDAITATLELSTSYTLTAKDCRTRDAGYVGLVAETGVAKFTNFSYTGTPQMAAVTATYSQATSGFSLNVPKSIIGDGGACVADMNDCAETCDCSYRLRSILPEDIVTDQTNPDVSNVGEGKRYNGNGGVCRILNVPGDCPDEGENHTPTPDWIQATLRISSTCIPSCPEGSVSSCSGVDVWGGWCLPPLPSFP